MNINIMIIALAFFANVLYAQEKIQLYTDSIPNSIGPLNTDQIPYLQIYLPKNTIGTDCSVLIFPGGAYRFLAYNEEGSIIAEEFAKKGITAFVIKYRLPKSNIMRDKSLAPLMDAQQAIKLVRSNCKKWNIDPNKIGIVGFSAGGHLASTLGTHFNSNLISNPEKISLRPSFMILVYPVISMLDELTHAGSKVALLGMEPTKVRVDEFSNELQVQSNTPPTYLTHCGDDGIVDVNNSIAFYQALQRKGIDAELHIYPKGDHGFTQRLPVNEWLNPILLFLQKEGFYNN